MGKKKRHHVVTRGYQRMFADGERVQLCDKIRRSDSLRIRTVGTNDVWVVPHFNSYLRDGAYDPSLEDEWARVEAVVLPVLRQWHDGVKTEYADDAARVLASIHFARSYGFRQFWHLIGAEQRDELIEEIVSAPDVRKFWETTESTPFDGNVIRELSDGLYEELTREHGAFFLQRMVSAYHQCMKRLRELEVVAYRPRTRRVEFVLGDSPFVFWTKSGIQVGHQSRLALGDSDRLMLPIGRRLAVMFTSTKESDALLDVATVQELNGLTWRAAYRQVIGHPAANLELALARKLS